jgi:transcriptional regulator with XRE-family HTH domain
VSKSLIAQVESGHKPATPSLIAAAAGALDVDVTDLTGQPYRGSDARSDRIYAAIPQIRQALVYWDIPPILDVPPRPLDDLAAETERVNRLRMQAAYVELGALLPALISELVATPTRPGSGSGPGPSGCWPTPTRRSTRWPELSAAVRADPAEVENRQDPPLRRRL